ncbi:MAG: hypothetical protein Kow00120_06070 [Anaerolineae bacterium]
MGSHPVNLGFRFLLELAALFALGAWGSRQGEGVVSLALALGVPAIAAVLWATFRAPGDSSAGKAPVPIPGVVRLALELIFFVAATLALYSIGSETLSLVFGVAVVVHYAASYDRILWLLRQGRSGSETSGGA